MVIINKNMYTSKTIAANGINMSYFVTNYQEGTPWLILHGTRDSKAVWEDLLDQYGANHFMIALDLRGHGQTDKPDVPYSFDMYIEDLYEFCNALGLKTINLIGHSLGGGLSMYYTIKHPNMVKKLILMGCAASHRLDFKPDTDGKSHAEIINQMIGFFFPKERKIIPWPIVEYIQKKITTGWVNNITPWTHKRLNELQRVDLTELVSQIEIPTLLIFGALDGVAKVSAGQFLAEHIPQSQLHVIEDCGHFMFLERPQNVYNVLDKFI